MRLPFAELIGLHWTITVQVSSGISSPDLP